MYEAGFAWESVVKRSLIEGIREPSRVKRVKEPGTPCRQRRVTGNEEAEDVDMDLIEALRPFPALQDYLKFAHVTDEDIDNVAKVLNGNKVTDWSYFIFRSYVHPDWLVDWGIPHAIAVNLVMYACRYLGHLCQQGKIESD